MGLSPSGPCPLPRPQIGMWGCGCHGNGLLRFCMFVYRACNTPANAPLEPHPWLPFLTRPPIPTLHTQVRTTRTHHPLPFAGQDRNAPKTSMLGVPTVTLFF